MIKALSSLTTICSLHSICRAGMITGGWLWMSMPGQAASWRFVVPPQDSSLSFKQLTRELTERTSLEANPNNIIFDSNYLIRTSTNRAQGGGATSSLARSSQVLPPQALSRQHWAYPWLFTTSHRQLWSDDGRLRPYLIPWLIAGGTAIFETNKSSFALEYSTQNLPHHIIGRRTNSTWKKVGVEHELMKSFYLLTDLPTCTPNGKYWVYTMDERVAMLAVPRGLLKAVSDGVIQQSSTVCPATTSENLIRAMVNIIMVIMTTDYKKDQIHLPEILRRIR